MDVKLAVFAVCMAASTALAAPYEIGEEMESESFWKTDPMLFVQKHHENGFQFTSDEHERADSRLDGGVTYHGLEVYESVLTFGEDGGVRRVELSLFNVTGTEALRETVDAGGTKFRKRVRVEKSIDREGFGALLETVRAKLTKGGKQPKTVSERVKDASIHHAHQAWPRTDVPTQATLTWNYVQSGKKTETFKAQFVRLVVDGPELLAEPVRRGGATKKENAKGAGKISDNVNRESKKGDVYIDNIPMVDQGQKGYCSVASAARVLQYFGVGKDEHEIAQIAGSSAESGTSTRGMKEAVETIGKKFRLATVVCYGDFEKSGAERIDGLCDEVKAYNKAAKKMKKPAITDDMFIRRDGNVISYNPQAVDEAMDVEVRKFMRTEGSQKSKFTKFMKDIHEQVDKGIPLYWGVMLGIAPEAGLPQTRGGHMRLIIGYNDQKKEIIYSDSWGAGHEKKHMKADWAWTITHCLMYMKPLSR